MAGQPLIKMNAQKWKQKKNNKIDAIWHFIYHILDTARILNLFDLLLNRNFFGYLFTNTCIMYSSNFTSHLEIPFHISYDLDPVTFLKQATNDLEDMDKKRREEFKNYELEKEAMRREKLKMMSERERAEAEQNYRQQQEKHRNHPKVNHPVSIFQKSLFFKG